MKKYKHANAKKPTERVGFYIALSICMMAVGFAVWSAYSTMSGAPDPSDNTYISETKPGTKDAEEDVVKDPLQAVLRVTDNLVYPVKSHQVVKPYSEDGVYNSTLRDYRAHTGCDFAAQTGENVYAMCGGTVKEISVSELYGVIIEVDCGDFSVYYCGLDSDFAVEKGDEVSTGDTIGTVGQIPCESSDQPHVHIEIRVGDRLIDPLSVIENDG